jgi:hypothetical protein
MRLLVVIALVVAVLVGAKTESGHAASADVSHHSYVVSTGALSRPALFRSPSFLRRAGAIDSKRSPIPPFVSNRRLVYQGGPILPVTNVHLIFWYGPPIGAGPTVTDTFVQIMQLYVTQGSGKSLFKMLHQYFMINPDKTKTYPSSTINLAGTYVDSVTPFPSHCTHPVTGTYCITDADVQGEIKQAIIQDNWSYGLATNDVFIVFTIASQGHYVGSCLTSTCAAGEVSGQDWCAYHTSFPFNLAGKSDSVIYAYVPEPLGCSDLPGTPHGPGTYDFFVNLMSHEHIEMITDPLPFSSPAWVDRREEKTTGGEIADKCNFYFLPTYTSPSGAPYNQRWGPFRPAFPGSLYMLQDEFSNKAFRATGSGCVQRAS